MNNVYLRNGMIALIIDVIIFVLGWGCIVPDQLNDQTHLFGLIGDVEIVRGNTAVVFGMCALLSLLTLIAAIVEALVEELYHPRFNQVARTERPKKISGMRITDPVVPEIAKEDPVVPKMD